jgi:hypothetical protein
MSYTNTNHKQHTLYNTQLARHVVKIEEGIEERSRQHRKQATENKSRGVRHPVGSAQSLLQVRTRLTVVFLHTVL